VTTWILLMIVTTGGISQYYESKQTFPSQDACVKYAYEHLFEDYPELIPLSKLYSVKVGCVRKDELQAETSV